MAKITKVREFTHPHDYFAFSTVRVNNSLVAELGGRNAWVRISGESEPLIRRLRGGPGLPKEAIELDYDSRLDLSATEECGGGFYRCNLEIQPASRSDKFRAHFYNSNIAYRVSFQMALIAVALGAVGLV